MLHAEGRSVAQPLLQPAPGLAEADKSTHCRPESACNTTE